MPPLPLLGALLDTAGSALKAARGSGSSSAAAGNDASATTNAVPFAQTLKQSVITRRDAQLDRAIALYPRIEAFLQQGFRECAPFASSLAGLDALFDVYGG